MMNIRRIAVVSLSAAALFGLIGGVSAAQAAVAAASESSTVMFAATEPPGRCLPSEVGQRKRGPDGRMYECKVIHRA